VLKNEAGVTKPRELWLTWSQAQRRSLCRAGRGGEGGLRAALTSRKQAISLASYRWG